MASKKGQTIFGLSEENGTVIPQHTDGKSVKRRMKMQSSMTKRDFLAEVSSSNTHATFMTHQGHLNRYERWLAAGGQPEAGVEYALLVQTLTRFKYSLSKGIKKDSPLLGQSVRTSRRSLP